MNVQGQPDSYKVGVLLCVGSLLILEYLAQALVSHATILLKLYHCVISSTDHLNISRRCRRSLLETVSGSSTSVLCQFDFSLH